MARRSRPSSNRADAARLYLAGLYRDDRVLDASQRTVSSLLSRLAFVYHTGRKVVSDLRCKASFHDWRPTMCVASGGCARVALVLTQPNLLAPLSYHGFWLASALPAPLSFIEADSKQDSFRIQWWLRRGFVSDNAWTEVLRISPRWTIGEGGAFGCWFAVCRAGSGVGMNVGRSLRAFNRSHLSELLSLNLTELFATPIRGREHTWVQWRTQRLQRGATLHTEVLSDRLYHGLSLDDEAGLRRRYFDTFPWRLEARVDLCHSATQLGYDTIQIYSEGCSLGNTSTREQACGVEIVNCHRSCLALRNRKDRHACIPHLPLRTGHDLSLPCKCNNSLDILNCAATPASQPPPVARKLDHDGGRLKRAFLETMFAVPDCACSWCQRRVVIAG